MDCSGDNLKGHRRQREHEMLITQKGSGKQNSKSGIPQWKTASSYLKEKNVVEIVDSENLG